MKMLMPIATRCAGVVAGLFLCLGCAVTPERMAPAPPRFILTWRDYDGIHRPEQALFYLNDIALGRGEGGFRNALRQLDCIPARSIVMVSYGRVYSFEGNGPPYCPPYSDALGAEFRATAERRSLKVMIFQRVMPPKGPQPTPPFTIQSKDDLARWQRGETRPAE